MADAGSTSKGSRSRWSDRDHSKKFSTLLELNAFKPEAEPYEVADRLTRGLRVRVKPDGGRAFFLRLRMPDGKLRVRTLGRLGKGFGLSEARAMVQSFKAERAQTGDPFAEQRERRRRAKAERVEVEARAAVSAYTLADMVRDFLQAGQGGKRRTESLRVNTRREYARCLTRDLGDLAELPAAEVTAEQAQALYDAKAFGGADRKPAPVAARRLLAALSSAYGWAMRQPDSPVNDNPCKGLELGAHKAKPARALKVPELRRLMNGWPHGESPDIAEALELILRLGQRPSNVYAMRWQDLDLEAAVWSIPPESFKTGVYHSVPLPTAVVERLKARPRHPSGWVFVRWSRSGWSSLRFDVAAHTLRAMLEAAGVEPVSPKEIQKTCVTRAVDQCGVSRDTVNLGIQGHAVTGIAKHYLSLDLQADTRAALERWNAWLDALTGDNVVPLARPERSA